MIDISTLSAPDEYVIVDECDLHLFKFKWTPTGRGYAHREIVRGRKEYLHRVIAGAGENEIVDHINRDRRDNRRSNLKITTRAENNRNKAGRGRSGFRGVHQKRGRWQAGIRHEGRSWSLGTYCTEEEAAAAYDDALAYFGYREKHLLNFPHRTPSARAPKQRNIAPHGHPGVRKLSSGRFNARIRAESGDIGLGTYATAEEAVKAIRQWERENGA